MTLQPPWSAGTANYATVTTIMCDVVLPGSCELRRGLHFRGILGGPAEWCLSLDQTRHRLRYK
eukprot:5980804-Pyramimonas_sp.AAC.1